MINYKKLTGVGLVGYGTYLPRMRIKVGEIAKAYKADGEQISRGLSVCQKSVANWDEDAASMGYAAGYRALKMAGIDAKKIGALFVGSESHPYAVKPTSTIIGEALGIGNEYMAADLEFACKAATAGVQIIAGQIAAGIINYGLAIGADKAQAEPGDVLEYTAGAGAAGLLLGKRKLMAKLVGYYSLSSDTGDFWRRAQEKYPKHAGRFTGEPAYFLHVIKAASKYLLLSGSRPEDYDQAVFHMPNGKFPLRAAKKLGFSESQIKRGMIVNEIGNPYSASALLGFSAVLDKAKAGERILVVSYGSGAGSDVLSWVTTPLINKIKRKIRREELGTVYIDYGRYRSLID